MKLLALDGRTGATGPAILGALVGAGADPAVLAPVEDALGVAFEGETVDRAGVAATRVSVRSPDGGDEGDGGEGPETERTGADAVELVEGIDLPGPVRADALAVVERLADALGAVRGTDPGTVSLGEAGTDGALATVVGAALLCSDLAPDRVVTTPVAAGGGEVTVGATTHPVPRPATVEVAARADWSLRGGPVEVELLTPLAAAILAHHAEGVEAVPSIRVTATGHGAGVPDLDGRPNVLRAILGDAKEGGTGETDGAGADTADADGDGDGHDGGIAVLETTLDDASPELLGGLQATLAEAGARNVSVVPLTAKKSRPGHLVRVIARPADADRVARRLAEETGTLGVRRTDARHQFVADRRIETVEIEVGGESRAVDVKVASADGTVYDVSAEYDDAHAVARETDLPVREVIRRAEARFRGRDDR